MRGILNMHYNKILQKSAQIFIGVELKTEHCFIMNAHFLYYLGVTSTSNIKKIFVSRYAGVDISFGTHNSSKNAI